MKRHSQSWYQFAMIITIRTYAIFFNVLSPISFFLPFKAMSLQELRSRIVSPLMAWVLPQGHLKVLSSCLWGDRKYAGMLCLALIADPYSVPIRRPGNDAVRANLIWDKWRKGVVGFPEHCLPSYQVTPASRRKHPATVLVNTGWGGGEFWQMARWEGLASVNCFALFCTNVLRPHEKRLWYLDSRLF